MFIKYIDFIRKTYYVIDIEGFIGPSFIERSKISLPLRIYNILLVFGDLCMKS